MDYAWKAVVVFFGGFFLIRVIGRKSVSQLTLATTIVMIAIGAIFVQPIVVDTVPRTLVVISIFILILIILEYLQMKFDFFEKIFHGKAKVVIQNGVINTKNLKKLRMTVDKLEMQIRQNGISNLSDIKTGTIEPNGQLGYELMPDAKPLTVGEFKRLMSSYISLQQSNGRNQEDNIFQELLDEEEINNLYK